MRAVLVAMIYVVVLTSGCSTLPCKNCDPRGHYILAHKDGYPIDHEGAEIKSDKFVTDYVDPILSGIDSHAVRTWKSAGPETPAKVLLFVHGGLNTYRAGFERIAKLVDVADDAKDSNGLLVGSSYYPVFINWNSSLFSTVYDSLFEIRGGDRNPAFAWATSPFLVAGQAAESVLGAPRAWWFMGENWWDSVSRPTEREKKEEGPIKGEFLKRFAIGASYFFLFPIRGVFQPFIQTFGTPAWDMMKRRADLLVARRLPENRYADKGVAYELLNAIKSRLSSEQNETRWKTREGDRGRIEITLVGHSMGTMVIDRILQAFPEVSFRRVVYMGSASSIEEFESFVVPYLVKHKETDFWALRLSRTDEAWEINYYLFFVDRGSLLVWIDSYFENVTTPRQRRFGLFKSFQSHYFRRGPYIMKDIFPELTLDGKGNKNFEGDIDDPIDHSDFGEREIFRRILCMVDGKAFNVKYCHDGYQS